MAYTKSKWRRTVYVEDPDRPNVFLNLGPAKEYEGGEVGGDVGATTLGDGEQVILTGDPVRGNATAKYLYNETLHALWDKIERGVMLSRVRVIDTPVDDRRIGWNPGPRTLTGKLIKASPPGSAGGDNNSSDAELEFALDLKAATTGAP